MLSSVTTTFSPPSGLVHTGSLGSGGVTLAQGIGSINHPQFWSAKLGAFDCQENLQITLVSVLLYHPLAAGVFNDESAYIGHGCEPADVVITIGSSLIPPAK